MQRIVLISTMGLAAAFLCGCTRSAPAPEEEVRLAPVKVVNARLLSIGQKIELLGTTQPLPGLVARISAPFEGRLFSILKGTKGESLSEGQSVNSGDVIAQLDIRLIEASRDEARGLLQDLVEQKKQAEYAVEQSGLEVKRLEDLEKLDQNSNSKLVRPLEMKKARIALLDAESKLRGVQARQIAAEAKLNSFANQIELSTLRTPIAGRLGLLQVVPGQSLAIGAAIAEVIDLSQIDVISFVPQHIVSQLALEMPATIKSSDESKNSVGPTGKIVYLAVQAQAETGNYAVKIRFPNPDMKRRANAVVAVEVQTQPEKQRLTIPDTALMEDQDPPVVVVLEDLKVEKNKEGKELKKGKARIVRATVGVRDRAWHVIELLGLETAETKEMVPMKEAMIIVEGGIGLHDGDLVKIQVEED
ncbi:MAG TPA: efflux RND transporter periplasmic adaptor subunit [Gemmatales bacterium]|nr:efflux RND transporter periplasmic adaptor subunit [Gemmatales bacterium]